MSNSVTPVQVDTHVFSPSVKPPGSSNTLFLAGAGVRGLEIEGKFIKFTAIGVYLEETVVPVLAPKWKGKSAEELTDEFFKDVITGPFEKFAQVTMILPLTGQQYSEKVTENCVAIWKSLGIYTEAESRAVEKFIEIFKDKVFPPGSSILFTISTTGSLTISFSKDSSVPEAEAAVIENRKLSQAILESMIGKHGVSPEARQSLAVRVSDLLKQLDDNAVGNGDLEAEKAIKNSELEVEKAIRNRELDVEKATDKENVDGEKATDKENADSKVLVTN